MVIAEIRQVYGELFSEQETDLAAVLEQIYVKTDRQFIFLIDEWDCVMREKQEAEEMQRNYLDFLRNLLKDQARFTLCFKYVPGVFHDGSESVGGIYRFYGKGSAGTL